MSCVTDKHHVYKMTRNKSGQTLAEMLVTNTQRERHAYTRWLIKKRVVSLIFCTFGHLSHVAVYMYLFFYPVTIFFLPKKTVLRWSMRLPLIDNHLFKYETQTLMHLRFQLRIRLIHYLGHLANLWHKSFRQTALQPTYFFACFVQSSALALL